MTRRWFVLCACALSVMPAAHAEIQAGAGVRVITPEKYLPVSGGMGIPKPSKEKRGELTARALVFRKGDVSMAIVGLDLLGFPSVLCDRVRRKVPRIPAENIVIGSTHTHSAPDCYAFPDGRGGHTGDLTYIDSVCEKAAEAINEAIDRLQPASIKIASDEARGKSVQSLRPRPVRPPDERHPGPDPRRQADRDARQLRRPPRSPGQ